MHRLLPFAITLPLAATPIITNTGSAAIACITSFNPTQTMTIQASGPSIQLLCPDELAVAVGNANGLTLSANSSFLSPFIAWSFTGQLSDSFTETGGTGQGQEEFDISFAWSVLNDEAGEAHSQASLSYNGAVIWSAEHQNERHPEPETNTAVVTVPFTYGVPFSVVESVAISGGFNSGTNEFARGIDTASADLSVTHHDSAIDTPEPKYGKHHMNPTIPAR